MFFCLTGCNVTVSESQARKDKELFGRWISTQKVFEDKQPRTIEFIAKDGYQEKLRKYYQENKDFLVPHRLLLEKMFGMIFDSNNELISLSDTMTKRNINKVATLLSHDMDGLVDYLREVGYTSNLEQTFGEGSSDPVRQYKDIIKQYNAIMRMFFLIGDRDNDKEVELTYLRSVANRMFEFAFAPTTWPTFSSYLTIPRMHPIVRVFYSTIWYYLAGAGWKQWHKDCLDELKREHDKGKRIVYIAAGNDVYQLIKRGIYSFDMIDPLLPTQPRYYAEGWSWLVRENGKGDTITFDLEDRMIIATRTSFVKHGYFQTMLSTGELGDIPNTTTTWTLCDKKTSKRLGTWVIHRRCVTQDDLKPSLTKAFLISFNELYFLVTQNPKKTWGVRPDLLDDRFTIHVKQLRRPVTAAMMRNMAMADASKDFSFIALGSEIN